MSLALNFNSSAYKRDKRGKEIKVEEDLASARIRLADGSYGTFRNGKRIDKADAGDSKFVVPTAVATLVVQPEGEKENRVEKRIDVNAPGMKL